MNTIVWHDTPETFYLLSSAWDVAAAKRILQAKKRLTLSVLSVSEVGELLQKPAVQNENGSFSFNLGVRVDWKRAATEEVDLSVPVILAYTKRGSLLPIDGYHRIAKAILNGIPTLPCVCLTKAESKKVSLA